MNLMFDTYELAHVLFLRIAECTILLERKGKGLTAEKQHRQGHAMQFFQLCRCRCQLSRLSLKGKLTKKAISLLTYYQLPLLNKNNYVLIAKALL